MNRRKPRKTHITRTLHTKAPNNRAKRNLHYQNSEAQDNYTLDRITQANHKYKNIKKK